ncbi:hypothetical protein [Flavobacterium kingsejongi]|uniref:Uncharacterized protein n=1 Tax=Flavobacterium kingsejongi TaxID=1678728 RepID=A0A2S1LN55_9FLAO|nr:hypothetical protein [Flavobacterium kingsejongi]AWG24808.1 hypothetical protein FK004_05985 [Flavobacterium kingsejongi]AWG25046.1 hypothetical protein FK004_07270 [Flavobacterium kingsejongi]
MSVKIKPITDHEVYEVNGKEVYKDSYNNWIARESLTSAEHKAFANYKRGVINNPAFKPHKPATYL